MANNRVAVDLAGKGYKQWLSLYQCPGVAWRSLHRLVLTDQHGKLLADYDMQQSKANGTSGAFVDKITASGTTVRVTWTSVCDGMCSENPNDPRNNGVPGSGTLTYANGKLILK